MFLVLTILLQVFVNVGIGVYYHLNKAYITQKLCENKNKPALHCNGQCYLSKQLKKAEEGEQKQAQSIAKEKEEIISNEVKALPGNYYPAFAVTIFRISNTWLYTSDNEYSLLKPPVA